MSSWSSFLQLLRSSRTNQINQSEAWWANPPIRLQCPSSFHSRHFNILWQLLLLLLPFLPSLAEWRCLWPHSSNCSPNWRFHLSNLVHQALDPHVHTLNGCSIGAVEDLGSFSLKILIKGRNRSQSSHSFCNLFIFDSDTRPNTLLVVWQALSTKVAANRPTIWPNASSRSL